MTRRDWIELVTILLVVLAVIVVAANRHPEVTVEQVVAHERSAVATHAAANAETVYVAAKASAQAARVVYPAQRDTVLRFLTDTVRVKEYVAHVDTLLAKDSVALAAADSAIVAEQRATMAVRTELAIALRPHPDPRLSVVASALYDPLTSTPAASAQVGVRLLRGLSLVARADQRLAPGEKPRGYLGVSVVL